MIEETSIKRSDMERISCIWAALDNSRMSLWSLMEILGYSNKEEYVGCEHLLGPIVREFSGTMDDFQKIIRGN